MNHATPIQIAPSILAADFTRLGEQIREAAHAGADMLHLDVMDGRFVPNISFGPLVVAAARQVTDLPLDTHLMIVEPEKYVTAFAEAGADRITVHVETCPHLHRVIQQIRAVGALPGVALNPHTPFEAVRDILPDVGRVLVMTVNPGFGGQAFIPATLAKIAQIRDYAASIRHPGLEIGVDGGIDVHTTPAVVQHGANVLIAGQAVFGAPEGIAAAITGLRGAARQADR